MEDPNDEPRDRNYSNHSNMGTIGTIGSIGSIGTHPIRNHSMIAVVTIWDKLLGNDHQGGTKH